MIKLNQYHLRLMLYLSLPMILLVAIYVFYNYSKRSYENNEEWLGRQVAEFYHYLGIELQYLHVSGNRYLTLKNVNNILNINDKTPINDLDINHIYDDMIKIGWVKDARIERHFPNELHIDIIERVPAAWFESQQRYYLIDDSGAIIGARDNISQENLDNIDNLGLPIIAGIGAPTLFYDYFQTINKIIHQMNRQEDIFISHAHYISKRRWNITLNNRVTLLLPQDDYDIAFRKIITLKYELPIMQQDNIMVDLRDKQRILVSASIKSSASALPDKDDFLEITYQQLQSQQLESMTIRLDKPLENNQDTPFLIMPIEAIQQQISDKINDKIKQGE